MNLYEVSADLSIVPTVEFGDDLSEEQFEELMSILSNPKPALETLIQMKGRVRSTPRRRTSDSVKGPAQFFHIGFGNSLGLLQTVLDVPLLQELFSTSGELIPVLADKLAIPAWNFHCTNVYEQALHESYFEPIMFRDINGKLIPLHGMRDPLFLLSRLPRKPCIFCLSNGIKQYLCDDGSISETLKHSGVTGLKLKPVKTMQ